MHTSVRGIIKNDDGIILIHRIKKNSDVEIRDYYFFKQNKTLFKHYYIDYPFIDYYNTKSVPGLLSPVDYYEMFKH